MSDNVNIDPSTSPLASSIATDEIGGVHYQVVKIAQGSDGIATPVSAADPLPVRDVLAATEATLAALNPHDAAALYTGTLTDVGATAHFGTAGYASISVQVSGIGAYSIHIEGSNDGLNWAGVLFLPLNEFYLVDDIDHPGNYSVSTSTLYLRFNATTLLGSVVVTAVGRVAAGPSAADSLSMALAREQNLPLGVELISGVKMDTSRALMLSDGVQYPLTFPTGSAEPVIIDCTGYGSLSIQVATASVSLAASSDGITWTAQPALSQTGALSTTLTGNNIWTAPVITRYLRFTPNGWPVGTITLKQAPASFGSVNIVAVNSTTAVTGGISGTLGVGGASAVGIAPTTNPITAGGVDPAGLSRRVLMDTAGRTQVSGVDQQGIPRGLAQLPISFQGGPAINVRDTDLAEGASSVELLAHILLELRILTLQLQKLPLILAAGLADIDEPASYRNDPTLFQ